MHYCIMCNHSISKTPEGDNIDLKGIGQKAYCVLFKDVVFGEYMECEKVRNQEPSATMPYCGLEAKLWVKK